MAWLVVGLAALVGVSACGLGAQDAPVPVQGANVRSTGPGLGSGSLTPTAVPFTMQAYLLRGDRLVRVEREVAEGSGIGPPLAALSLPLTRDEVAQGLRTALPTTADAVPLTGRLTPTGVAEVDVPPGFDRLSLREQEAALAQLVFTLTADTIATGVQVASDGRALSMPDATGQLLSRPLERTDFTALAPAS
ncbi:GerMN domain-containing protein [Humibacillus xanthopallidus]|uniref:Sporulation and spore germination protein n=1 Tax=Humibacillus xanthopallidus TaxID=412689 RepID=A0A543HIG3_9MICO|nr:GerMN domain-containing protein [Humibacillus xanthopallidus]TQM58121.1 hypothetical protein FBY41_3479 [Humibacillus xanthopallidus]